MSIETIPVSPTPCGVQHTIMFTFVFQHVFPTVCMKGSLYITLRTSTNINCIHFPGRCEE